MRNEELKMYDYMKGIITEVKSTGIVLEVGGIGYHQIPMLLK